jgi:DNA invertase Pin-like site-specific DNA recombinase
MKVTYDPVLGRTLANWLTLLDWKIIATIAATIVRGAATPDPCTRMLREKNMHIAGAMFANEADMISDKLRAPLERRCESVDALIM